MPSFFYWFRCITRFWNSLLFEQSSLFLECWHLCAPLITLCVLTLPEFFRSDFSYPKGSLEELMPPQPACHPGKVIWNLRRIGQCIEVDCGTVAPKTKVALKWKHSVQNRARDTLFLSRPISGSDESYDKQLVGWQLRVSASCSLAGCASLIDNLGCLWTKKGLQGGKTIQQRSESSASQWSLMLLPVLYIYACALFAHTRVRACVSLCQCNYSSLVGCHITVPSRSWDHLLRHSWSHHVTR